jgi:hypothetical protein
MGTLHKYPKLLILFASTLFAYVLYIYGGLDWLHGAHGASGYLAAFIGGLLFTFGFTAPFGIGVFLEIGHSLNPILGTIVGGIGALLADLLIFQIMRFELFHDELHSLRSARVVQWMHEKLHHENFPEKLRKYLLWSFAGIIIASPVPDEFGVALVSSLTTINKKAFAILSLIANMSGILLMILGSKLIG